MPSYKSINKFNTSQQEYFKKFTVLKTNFILIQINNFNKQFILYFLSEFNSFGNISFLNVYSKKYILLEFKTVDQLFFFVNFNIDKISFENFYFTYLAVKLNKNLLSINLFKQLKLRKEDNIVDIFIFLYIYIILNFSNIQKLLLYFMFYYFNLKNFFFLNIFKNVNFTSVSF
jgi:hypothetical protein